MTRKQREIQAREAQILEVARDILLQDGYLGLNMDRIAVRMEYSKGTIYQHFGCKEDIILALANLAQEKRLQLFSRAAEFRGGSRERVTAIGRASELFFEQYPYYFKAEQIIRSASLWEKTSEERRDLMRRCEVGCLAVVGGVVRDGLAQGDLELPPEMSPEDLVFGMWSCHLGAFSIISTSQSLPEIGIAQPVAALRLATTMLLDGYRWRPLSSEHDYSAVLNRVDEEVFHDELATA